MSRAMPWLLELSGPSLTSLNRFKVKRTEVKSIEVETIVTVVIKEKLTNSAMEDLIAVSSGPGGHSRRSEAAATTTTATRINRCGYFRRFRAIFLLGPINQRERMW